MNSSCSFPQFANALEACINVEEINIQVPKCKFLTNNLCFKAN